MEMAPIPLNSPFSLSLSGVKLRNLERIGFVVVVVDWGLKGVGKWEKGEGN